MKKRILAGILAVSMVGALLTGCGKGASQSADAAPAAGTEAAAEADQNVVKSGRNIPGCEVTFANLLNVYDIVNANKLVVDKAALAKIEEVFA